MKTKLITLLVLIIFANSSAQIFTEHTITNFAIGATCAHAVDFDNDGDKDVLSASRDDNTISWFENTDFAREQAENKLLARDVSETRSGATTWRTWTNAVKNSRNIKINNQSQMYVKNNVLN